MRSAHCLKITGLLLAMLLALPAPAQYGCDPTQPQGERARMQQYLKKLEDCLAEQEADANCSTEFYQIKDAFDQILYPKIRLESPPLKEEECPDYLMHKKN